MKPIYALLLFFPLHFFSQERRCGTDMVMKRLYEKNPALKLKKQKLNEEMAQQTGNRPTVNPPYVIPIVFHILHLNGPENISDTQVKDAVNILNRDYARKNADTVDIIPPFKNIADSTQIHFVLATKDPQGNCTNGIKHYFDPDADWDETSPTLYSHTWDPTRYLNVYVVRTITLIGGFPAAGYAYFPGSWLPGDPHDGVVLLNNYFGSIGTSSAFQSRVLTHEVGHWLDLYHVFGQNGVEVDCTSDDFVSDTPPTAGFASCPPVSNPSSYQLCTPGVSENFQNYMDYSYCDIMFTSGQAARMQAALNNSIASRDSLWTNHNLIVTGVISPTAPCLPIADFKYNRKKICKGSSVVFTDVTWNGTPTSYNWTFSGGIPATSTSSAPVVTYNTPGLYSVTFSSSNSVGSSSPITKTNIITVTENTVQSVSSWGEGFENLTQLNANWMLESSSGSTKWEQTSDVSYTGTYSAKIAYVNNTRKTITSMTGPPVNLSGISNPFLSFKVAAAEINPAHINKLKVYISTDCGNTWSNIYSKTGSALVTSNNTNPDFFPSGASDWRNELVNLQPYSAAAHTMFRFEYTRDTIGGPNNIYVDDININGSTSITEISGSVLGNFSLFPNPTEGSFSVSFDLPATENITMTLFDILGREKESSGKLSLPAGNHVFTYNENNNLSPGVYLFKIKTSHEELVRKVVVRN
jgi:PKD repeat protein